MPATPAPTTQKVGTARLAELIDARLACIRNVNALSRKQLELIKNKEMVDLTALLERKQKTFKLLEQVERALDPFRDEEPEDRVWESQQLREETAAKISECEELLRETFERDKESEEMLSESRDEAAQKLRGLAAAGPAKNAYIEDQKPGDSHGHLNFDA